MDEHTLRVLEFDKIIAKLQTQAACALGREAAGRIYPTTDLEVAKRRQMETSEARGLMQYEGNIPLGGIEDVRAQVDRASIGSLLQPSDLLSVRDTLYSCRRLGVFLAKHKTKYPILGQLGSEIQPFEKIEEAISEAISQGGEVLDSASPALARVRSELRTIHSRLTEKINSFIQGRDYRTIIQEPVITIRNDRYCIPIKSEYRGQFPGIVHDASTSGATVFVEPAAVVELGNKRKELVSKEREEIEKVLAKLSGSVGAISEQIQAMLGAVASIDCITARAKLGILQDATEPALNRAGQVELLSARHPLLEGDVMPIDVKLGKDFGVLLITGPNTGGKTVTLKTVGLFALMAASGLQVPARTGTEVAIFDKVFADIGDEQSIEQSLSTFSSHLRNIVHITQESTKHSLVLLDEVGAGTDPAEGAALAKAILDFLLDRGVKVVATTHYGELKEFAYMRDGIENASVEFDPVSLRPTYRLMIGIPGSSNAFAIASRLGLCSEIVELAKANIATHVEATDELIRRIEESHRAASEQRRLAERSSTDAEALRRRYEEQLGRLDGARDRVEKQARDRAQSMINSYTRKLDGTLEQLAMQNKDSKRAQDLKKKAEKLIEQFEERAVEAVLDKEPKDEPLPKGTELTRGTRVRIAGVNQDGEIVEPPSDGKVVVLVGQMRVTVRMSALRKARSESMAVIADRSAESKITMEKARDFQPELHLLGMRVEPALIEIEKYLDNAMAAGIDNVRIIHGKGTGQLKKAVWEYLKSHPGVKSYRIGETGEGGAGATIVVMK